MIDRLIGVAIAIVMALVAVGYQVGSVAPRDAFFLAAALVIVFTGQQLIAREKMGLAAAAKSILTTPSSFKNRTSFAAYFVSLALGLFVTAQVLTFA